LVMERRLTYSWILGSNSQKFRRKWKSQTSRPI